jgi:hypothetical protein
MRAEVVQIIADWLEHEDYGVNAMLAEVPRSVGVSQPADVSVADETRDDWVARNVAPQNIAADNYIAVAMYQEGSFEGLDLSSAFTWQEGEVPVVIRHVTSNVSSAAGNLASAITLRAVRWSLNLLRRQENDSSRTKNLVKLLESFSILEIPAHEQLGDTPVIGGLLLRCNAMDAVVEPV